MHSHTTSSDATMRSMSHRAKSPSKPAAAARKRVCVPDSEALSESGLREALAVGAVKEVFVVEQPDGWFRVRVRVRWAHLGDRALQERWVVGTRRYLREWRGLNRLTALLIGMPGMPRDLSLQLQPVKQS